MIRPAESTDFPVLYDLICDLEDEEFPIPILQQQYRRLLHHPDHLMLVHVLRQQITGMIHLRFEDQLHHGARVCEIVELVIHPDHRSLGIGRQLLQAARQQAMQQDCVMLELTTNRKRTDAHRFYEREGMQQTHFKYCLPLE